MNLRLVLRSPEKGGEQSYAITHFPFFVGRDHSCHLQLPDPYVSKRHCVLLNRNGHLFVQDLRSMNGTFVNDVQVRGEREISEGNRIKLGRVVFRVELGTADKTAALNQILTPPESPAGNGDSAGSAESSTAPDV